MRSESLSWAVRGAGFAVGVGLVLALAWLAIAARDVLFLVFLAILLGAGLEPVISWLRSRLPLGRGPAILVVYAAFLALVGVMALLVVPAALVQIELALNRLPTFLETIRGWSSALRPTALADGIDAVIDSAERALRPAPPDAGAVVDVSLVVAAGGGAVVTLLTLVFFWLTERSRLQRYALAFLPEHRRAGIRDAWNAIETRLGLWVRGQLVLMAALGAATAVAYSLLGLPAALLLALIAALAEIVPMVGPLIGALPALLVATTVSNETAVLTLVVYVVIQFLEANVLVPIVMRNAIGLSPFLVAVSLLAGYTVGGPLGAIVAVPAMAAVEAVLERLQARDVPVQIDVSNEAPDDAEREAQEEHPPAAPAPKPRRRSASRTPSRAASRG